MRIAIYLIIVLTAILPIAFRRVYRVRLICVFLLGFIASLHVTFLLTEHRLLWERGIEHFGHSSTKPLPDDFQVAVSAIQELSQGQMPLVFLLIIAFVILALVPFGGGKPDGSKH